MYKTFFLVLFSYLVAQERYDPLTGERIQIKKFDPNTGEIIEKKYDPETGEVVKEESRGLISKVILKTGDTIKGKLILQDKYKVIIDSKMIGEVSIDRENIQSIVLEGIPSSTRRVTKTPKIVNENLNASFKSNQNLKIASNARVEAQKSNSQILNTLIGTGACLNPAVLVTLPVMGIAIYANVNVKEPTADFYYNLDSNQKKQYLKLYKKEIRKLRTQQCFTPAGLVLAFFGFMMATY